MLKTISFRSIKNNYVLYRYKLNIGWCKIDTKLLNFYSFGVGFWGVYQNLPNFLGSPYESPK